MAAFRGMHLSPVKVIKGDFECRSAHHHLICMPSTVEIWSADLPNTVEIWSADLPITVEIWSADLPIDMVCRLTNGKMTNILTD